MSDEIAEESTAFLVHEALYYILRQLAGDPGPAVLMAQCFTSKSVLRKRHYLDTVFALDP